jgi:PadR family transcriptional regulator PadR
MDDALESWNSQIRRGVLELCILAILEEGPSYGYGIVTRLSASRLALGEGTVYPLLRRLRRDGHLETTWQESDAGPPRQYYRLSPAGQEYLNLLRGEWRELVGTVRNFIAEGSEK